MMLQSNSGFKIGVALFVAFAAFASPASAGLREQQQQRRQQTDDCKPDAMRFCQNYVPNVDAITVCMQQHVKQLTPACRRYFQRGNARS